MTTDLAAVPQLPGTPDLPGHDREAAEADNTRRSYPSAWRRFQTWTAAGGHQALPATPQTVALYLGHLAATGRSMATIEQARAAAGMQKGDNPARHPVVAEAVRGWRNQAPAPRQADALTADALARVREVLRLPRRGRGGRLESPKTAQRRAALGSGHHRRLGRRQRPSHGPEGQEPGRAGHGGSDRGHHPRPAGDPAGRRRHRSSGVRATGSADTAAASAWHGGWWRQRRPTRRCSARAGESTETWWPGTPGARRTGRPSSGWLEDL